MRAATGADLRENQYINDQSNIDMIDRMLEFLDTKKCSLAADSWNILYRLNMLLPKVQKAGVSDIWLNRKRNGNALVESLMMISFVLL